MRPVAKITALVFVLLTPIRPSAVGVLGRISVPNGEPHNERSRAMAANVYVYLFDLRTYREEILPAYRGFIEKDDTTQLIGLVKQIVAKIDNGEPVPYPELWDKESYEEDIGILDGTVYYSPDGNGDNGSGRRTTREAKQVFVRDHLSSKLVLALCVPRPKG